MHNCTFEKSKRILTADEYKIVMSAGSCVYRTQELTLILKYNVEQEYNRLGLIVSKKVSKKSVIRNKIKRIAREVFRLYPFTESTKRFDLVFIAKNPIANLSKKDTAKLIRNGLSKIPAQKIIYF